MPSLRRAGWTISPFPLAASRPLRRARLALVAGAIVCISVIALAVLNLWYEREEDLRRAERNLVNLGHALSEHLTQRVESIDLALSAALSQFQDQAFAPAQIARILRAHADTLTFVPAIGLYGAHGELLAGSTNDPHVLPPSLAGSESMSVHRPGRIGGLHIAAPVRSPDDGAWHVVLSRAVRDSRGEFRGIIAAIFDPQRLVDTYRSMDLGADASIALLDWRGTLLASYPWRDEMIARSFVDGSVLKDASDLGDGASRLSPFDRRPVLASDTTSRAFPLTLTVMSDRHAVLASWRRHVAVGGTAAALTGVLALAFGVLLDRHVRRREESVARLRVQQAELTDAQRIARLGSWYIDGASGRVRWSAEAAALLGVPADVVPSLERLLAHVHDDDRLRLERAWAGLLATGQLDLEFRTAAGSGEPRWLRARAEQPQDGNEKSFRVRGTLLDVTEERRAQQAMQHLAAIVESTEDAILSITADGRILSWNRGATRMFGYRPEETIGRRLPEFLPARKAALAQRLVARSASGETIEAFETRVVLPDKRAIHIAVTLSPLRDAEGRITAASAVARDITGRRQAELRRQMEHRIAQLLAESAPLAVTMPRILEALCRSTGFDCALQFSLEPEAPGHRLTFAWGRPGWPLAQLTSWIGRHMPVADEHDLPWQTSDPQWLDGVEISARQPWLQRGGKTFATALLVPISVGGRVVSVLELLGARLRTHDAEMLASARIIGSQIGQYFERKHAEDALRAEQEYIGHVIAAAPTLIASVARDGTTRSVNPAIRDVAGYGPEELQGRHFWHTLQAGDDAAVAKLLAAAASGGAADYPLAIRTRSGDLRDLALSAAARRSPEGAIVEYILVGTDVTARRLDEARRAAEYAVTRALVEEQSERKALERVLGTVCEVLDWDCAVYRVVDPATRLVACTCSWSKPSASLEALVQALMTPRTLGAATLYSRTIDARHPQWDNDLPSRVSDRLRPTVVAAGIRSAMSVPVRAGERILGALQFFGRSNNRPASVLVDAMHAIGDQVGQFIERKRVEAAQQQADERLRNIAANIPGIVFEYRLRPDGTAAFEFVSERSVDILEERPEALMRDPRNMFKLVEPAYRRPLLRSMRVSRDSRSLWLSEMPVRTASGRVRWVRGQSMPKYLDDGSVVWDGVIVDVTAQKQAEQAIQQMNEQLERRVAERTAQLSAANRELESFAYSVSHDLRAPLRSIDGFSRILAEEYGHTLEPTAADYLTRVRNASQRMSKLIDDLLSLSRVTRSELKRVRTDLSAIAEAIVQELRAEAPERSVDVSIHPGMLCLADPSLIRIALYNLLGNAWKFTSKRASARIEFGALTQRSKTVYYVRDNGAGFDMAHAGKLFGAFQRLHSPREFEGTGVGLATVSRIIDRHGGTVWAESVLDKGATFYFTLSSTARQ
jgi:PAS domain S-box-containing protein